MSASAADSQQPADQVTPEQVSTLPPVTTQRRSPDEVKEDARWTIARRLVLAYVILLAFSLAIPMALLWSPRVSNGFSVSDARDLMLAMSGTLSGLVGILGFVMGYYFKELDKSAATGASTPRSKKR
jgi:hypothetical protein